jgi:hypothetical protein
VRETHKAITRAHHEFLRASLPRVGMARRILVGAVVSLLGCQGDRLVPAYSVTDELTVECSEGDFTLDAATPEVMLVLDRSGSMSSAFGSGSRWSTLVSALEVALPPVNEQMALGLTLYPSPGGGGQECTVPESPEFWPATGQVGALLASVRSSTLVGGTPIALALDVAAAALTSTRPRAMVLATDGLPNCNATPSTASCSCPSGGCTSAVRCIDDARTLDALNRHAEAGIPTWIIGIGGDVTGTTLLDAMAVAGGRPASGAHRSLSASSPVELQAAFVQLRDELSSCVFTSPSVPDANGSLVVMLDGVIVPNDASGIDGWVWSSQARGELTLRGSWCAKAIAARSPVVRISVTCGVDQVDEESISTLGS